MSHHDLPSHPTYNHSNPLLDTSTASAEEDDEYEEQRSESDVQVPVHLLNVPLVERGISLALSADTGPASEATTDVPETADFHTYTGNQPPRRQSAQRTKDICQGLRARDEAAVAQEPIRVREQDGDVTIQDERDQHRNKRVKMEYAGADDADDGEEDGRRESSILSDEPDESQNEDSASVERSSAASDAEGSYEAEWAEGVKNVARRGYSDPEESDESETPSSPMYYRHMESRSFEDQTAMREDIRRINLYIRGLKDNYTVVDRLGEGTFSSVYKAIDKNYSMYDNRYWESAKQVPQDPSSRKQLEREAENEDTTSRLSEQLKVSSKSTASPSVRHADGADAADGHVWVALKRIYVTSSPDRIQNELDIMEDLRSCRNVAQLITAFRDEDQVIISMPYQPNDDFRLFFRHLDPPNIRKYMRCLFRGLNDCHRRGIIHRDVKPANFLFDYASGHGVLVDFGLAERYYPPSKVTCQHAAATYLKPHGYRVPSNQANHAKVEQAVYDAKKRISAGRVGIPKNDDRPAVRANRAGTRGFRAPEVLLKCPDQTVAIDVWAAGVILLSILCQKFPVFVSSDDMEALLEIGSLFGQAQLEKAGILHNRIISTTVPSFTNSPNSLTELVCKLNPKIWEPPSLRATPAEAKAHIRAMDSALDLLKRLLVLDPTRRYTSHQALMHGFLQDDLPLEEKEKEEVLHAPGEGACKAFHWVNDEGLHFAMVERRPRMMQWGQGMAIGNRRELALAS
ncbi:hypothetical protein QFC22_004110 [Naganishia vaughanmartiniae]|uniref:Uncharacterized protein n=1 Tax=Naganishia vaughanmartiniae TaxID=1424756 RepID=A0ACC2X458_9TREE|nr:hypothetical protein QFC22_004110 [Naganishia vaughanmartiniae]